MIIDGIRITVNGKLNQGEIDHYVNDEIRHKQGKELAEIILTVEGDEVEIKSIEKSPIKRIRRITGYLSELPNFNPPKQVEERDRYKHFKIADC